VIVTNLIGAVVKYNPSSSYAKNKKNCLNENPKKVLYQNPKFGDKQEDDSWFEKVLKGEMKSFYPKRVKIFEIPGSVLVLFHCKMRAIVGEATITRSTQDGEVHNYYFERFLLYPKKISLTDENNEPRFYCIPTRGQWWVTYIDDFTLKEIRRLSGLKKKIIKNLNQDTASILKETKKFFLLASSRNKNREACKSKLENEIKKLSTIEDSVIINEAKRIFLDITKTGRFRGHSFKSLFYAGLYLAYREHGIAKSLRDISKSNKIELRELKSDLKYLKQKFDISIPRISLEKRVKQYSKQLNLSTKTIETAIKFTALAKEEYSLKNRNPRCISASAIYAAAVRQNVPLTKKEISKVTNVTSASLRTISKLMLSHKNY